LIALSVGGFIYLAAAELVPEMQKEKNFEKSVIHFSCLFSESPSSGL
jgi:hypothetical protein